MSYKIIKLQIDKLIPYAGNSRTHSDDQVNQIAASIKEFGFNNPILVDAEDGIIAGHGRVLAAQKLGMDEVPTICLSHLSDAQRRAYVIADNKLAMNAGWDDDALRAEMDRLKDDNFDISLLGFDDDEMGEIFGDEETEGLTDEDEVPEPPAEPKTIDGDIWLLGNHRLMCGDSTSVDAVEKLMDGEKADAVLTDPPYGIDYGGMLKGKGDGNGGADKNGWKSHDAPDWDKTRPDESVFNMIRSMSENIIIWGGNYFADILPPSMGWLIWDKGQRGFSLADGEMAWTSFNNALRIKNYARASANREEKFHPTQKPVEIIEWCIEYLDRHSKKDVKVISDSYGGSGTTLIACEKTNRKCRMMELDPKYCDVIITRWQDFTGKEATHADTGKTFNESH